MRPHRPRAVVRYAISLVLVAVAFGLRYLLNPMLGEDLPFGLFVLATLLAAWLGGLGPGVLALVLGYLLGDYFFLPPIYSLLPGGPDEFLTLMVYLFTGFFGISVIETLHRVRETLDSSQEHQRMLEKEIREREQAQRELSQARDQLAQLNQHLEQTVRERTYSLKATTEELNTFCYSVAHDLKAPLRAQVSFAELLVAKYGQELGKEGTGYATHIIEAATRQADLVDALLAHISVGRTDLRMEPTDLARMTGEVLADLVIDLEEKQAIVEMAGVEHTPVRANPASVYLVLLNLVSNACKFVSPGTQPHVRLWTESRDALVRLCVEDNGIGIARQDMTALFGAFQRLHTAKPYPGTGIGLALVKRAVERMGGSVGLASELGKGSVFWVELAAAKPQNLQSAVAVGA